MNILANRERFSRIAIIRLPGRHFLPETLLMSLFKMNTGTTSIFQLIGEKIHIHSTPPGPPQVLSRGLLSAPQKALSWL